VSLLAGGLDGWAADGGELFRDVNAPSKAFGELVAATAMSPARCGRCGPTYRARNWPAACAGPAA
jgi:hypothetical protein